MCDLINVYNRPWLVAEPPTFRATKYLRNVFLFFFFLVGFSISTGSAFDVFVCLFTWWLSVYSNILHTAGPYL
jgi:hypothetical protein